MNARSGERKQDGTRDAKELLLADYRHLYESFWRNEGIGESRTKFFITLVTAVLAALVALLKNRIGGEQDRLPSSMVSVLVLSLSALLLFGLITLMRIIKRNEVTDGYKKDMDGIRARFRHYFDESGILKGYYPHRGSSAKLGALRRLGGLTHTVAVMNSIIISVLVFIGLYSYGIGYSATMPVLAFGGSFWVQFAYARRLDRRGKDGLFTHAGGVVVKPENCEARYLIVTAKNNPEQWVLPKGHVEGNDSLEDTASREVAEETGVLAEAVKPIGKTMFIVDSELVYIKFFAMKQSSSSMKKDPALSKGDTEKRKKVWCAYEEARAKLTFDQSKKILRLAHEGYGKEKERVWRATGDNCT